MNEARKTESRFDELSELFEAVAASRRKIHIDVDFDGKKFTWKAVVQDMTAEQFTNHNESGVLFSAKRGE